MKYSNSIPRAPTKPCSSEKAAKMKSCAGRAGKALAFVCLESFPCPDSARAHRDQRLIYLIPLVLRIRVRVHENGQPVLLILLQPKLPGWNRDHRQRQHDCRSVLAPDPPRNNAITAIGKYVKAVPMSGCARTSSIGTPTTEAAFTMSKKLISRAGFRRSTRPSPKSI